MPPFPLWGGEDNDRLRTTEWYGESCTAILSAFFPPMHRLAPFRWTVVLVLALAMVLEMVNGRFWLNDLRVYVMAADALRHGDLVYGLPFGLDTGFYKYAPGLLYFFIPYTFIPFTAACVLHFVLISAALVSVFLRMERLLMRHLYQVHPPKIKRRAFLGFLCVAVHLVRELHLGNVNVLLLWCVVVALEAMLEERDITAGLLLGLTFFVKPYLLLCVVPMVVLRRTAVLGWALVAVIIGLALPMLIEGPATGWSLNGSWVAAMRAHGDYLTSTNTLRSLLSTLVGRDLPARWDLLFIATAGVLVAAVTWLNGRKDRSQALILGLSVALACVPLLVVTDVQHFLLALPLILWVLAQLFRWRSPLRAVVFTLAMLAYGTDSTDLWGSDLAARFEQVGLVGWGTLLLLLTAILAPHLPSRAS